MIGGCLRRSITQVLTDESFYAFSKASEDTYAAVIYERNVYEDGPVSVSFINYKYKLAPMNAYSNPDTTLELYLCKVVSKVLGGHIVKKSVFWCDSMNVLYWIKNPSRKFKSFVAN